MGTSPSDWIVDCRTESGRRAIAGGYETYLENLVVSGFVKCNGGELLDGHFDVGEARSHEIGLLELAKCLAVERALHLLKDIRELCA